MHLTREACAVDGVVACLAGWLSKTHTAFVGFELNLPWYYGLFCWNYAIAGLVLLYTKPAWTAQTKFPYTAFALGIVFLQAPLSFTADYLYMTEDSIWHLADRAMALPMTGLEIWRVVLLWQYDHFHFGRQRPLKKLVRSDSELGERIAVISYFCLLYTALLVAALMAFMQSNHAQSVLDRDGFVFWHCIWHLYPIANSLLTLYDWFTYGQQQGGGGGGPVLQFKLVRARNNKSHTVAVAAQKQQ